MHWLVYKNLRQQYQLIGNSNPNILNLLVFDADGTIYVPVKAISEYLGYTAYNGEYAIKSEEPSKCYVECDNEIVNLQLNSNRVYKLNLENDNQNYTYFDMKKKVKAINGELYISSDAMSIVFNTDFKYNQEKYSITFNTMPYLIKSYSSKVLDYGYESISESFENEKTIFNGYLVVQKSNSSKNSIGVINISDGSTIIEPKYSNIRYLPEIGEFVVESNNKYGVIVSSKETTIKVIYDSIQLIDRDASIYIVKKDNKYGIIDTKGNIKVNIEYDDIGIDKSKFSDNTIKNNYLIADGLIPIKKDDLWGMIDKNGKLIVDFYYDSFGYIASNNKNAKNLLVIPDYNVVITCKDKKYGMINSSGEVIFAPIVDDIYLTYENGNIKYYILYNDQKMDAEEFLDKKGITKSSDDVEELNNTKSNKTTNSNSSNTSSNTSSNQNTSETNSENTSSSLENQ